MAMYLGKCLKCGGKSRVTAEDTGERRDTTGRGYMRPVLRLADGTEVTPLDLQSFTAPCVCGASVVYQRIIGKLNRKKVCNWRCLDAIGPSCECSCAGANHGASYDQLRAALRAEDKSRP